MDKCDSDRAVLIMEGKEKVSKAIFKGTDGNIHVDNEEGPTI